MSGRLVLAGVAAALVAAAAPPAHGAGLRVQPGLVVGTAEVGEKGRVIVSNPGRTAARVTAQAREWRQVRDGGVVASGRRMKGFVISPAQFDLRPGERRAVRITLGRAPKAGFAYAALAVRATELEGSRAVGVASQVVASIRIRPRRVRVRHAVGTARAAEAPRSRRVVQLRLRNAGNQVDPLVGLLRLRGGGRTRVVELAVPSILPGRTSLARTAPLALAPGRYRFTASFSQLGRRAGVRRGVLVVRAPRR